MPRELLHDDFLRHLGMNRTEVEAVAWLRKGVREPLICIESLWFEGSFVVADDGMRYIVAVHVTVVSEATASVDGPKTKLSIVSSVTPAALSGGAVAIPL